jgi:hypothetical protein
MEPCNRSGVTRATIKTTSTADAAQLDKALRRARPVGGDVDLNTIAVNFEIKKTAESNRGWWNHPISYDLRSYLWCTHEALAAHSD